VTTSLVAFGTAFIVAVLATLAIRPLATRLGIVDKPDGERKIHKRPTPLLGGVAIYAAFVAPILLLYFVYRNRVSEVIRQEQTAVFALLGCGALVLAIGILDDIVELSARAKLALQLLPAGLAITAGYSIGKVSLPFGESLVLGIFCVPVTLFWFLGCMNAVNLLDGLDGLAAGVCLLATLTMLLVSVLLHNTLPMLLMCCLGGGILGFLLFNFHPASVFLGDSGSMLLGFLVAALSLHASQQAEMSIALLVPFIALGLPVLDTTLAIMRRLARRLPISAADRQHIHHLLLSMGLSHREAVIILYITCAIFGGAALLVTTGPSEMALLVIGSLVIIAFVCLRLFGASAFGPSRKRLAEELRHKQQSVEMGDSVERALDLMRQANCTDTLWHALSSGLEGLYLNHATFRLFAQNGNGEQVYAWSNDRDFPEDEETQQFDGWCARLKVRSNGTVLGMIELSKRTNHSPVSPNMTEFMERLRRETAVQIERLGQQDIEKTEVLAGHNAAELEQA